MKSFEDMEWEDANDLLRKATKIPAKAIKEGAEGTAFDYLMERVRAICPEENPQHRLEGIAYQLSRDTTQSTSLENLAALVEGASLPGSKIDLSAPAKRRGFMLY